jgi:hypothetical protein
MCVLPCVLDAQQHGNKLLLLPAAAAAAARHV